MLISLYVAQLGTFANIKYLCTEIFRNTASLTLGGNQMISCLPNIYDCSLI